MWNTWENMFVSTKKTKVDHSSLPMLATALQYIDVLLYSPVKY